MVSVETLSVPSIRMPEDDDTPDATSDHTGSSRSTGPAESGSNSHSTAPSSSEPRSVRRNQPADTNLASVSAPSDVDLDEQILADSPQSYKENLPKEKIVLKYAENFQRQFNFLYGDRKPLILSPQNECGVPKFVSTTIRATQLPYSELYDWRSVASFVADYLNAEPLNPPHDPPKRIRSPQHVLRRQRANAFEHSTLLCSLLLGAGYDAYVVSGYACRPVCAADRSRLDCPLTAGHRDTARSEEAETKSRNHAGRYDVKAAKDLTSRYEKRMREKRERQARENEAAAKEAAKLELEERLAPPPDQLRGLRVHSWVLVLAGSRAVPRDFFVEPFTALDYSTDHDNFEGIESVWNNKNYWVNMQDCRTGVKNLKYDLGDQTKWEFIFPSNDKPKKTLPAELAAVDEIEDEDEDEDNIERHLDLPRSWVEPIYISRKELEQRAPLGRKTVIYKRAKLEEFADYVMRDGLTRRLSVYSDPELQDLLEIREYYTHRKDKWLGRIIEQKSGWSVEKFDIGKSFCLREHRYRTNQLGGPDSTRVMEFYENTRVDGLKVRETTPLQMKESYHGRRDHLYRKDIEFGKRSKKFGPAEESSHRPIERISEWYHRDHAVDADENIKHIMYDLEENKVYITYHTAEDRISSSTREFYISPELQEKSVMSIMSQEVHSSYQVDSQKSAKKQIEIYQMLKELASRQEKAVELVRQSEMEENNILRERTEEITTSELEISVYDTLRNDKAKRQREEEQRRKEEEELRKKEIELDYLAPFLAKLGYPETLSEKEARLIRKDCLDSLKKRLVDKANQIQRRYEEQTKILQQKEQDYQQNYMTLSSAEEERYTEECQEIMFRVNVLKQRLDWHKEKAQWSYMKLDQKLKNDRRMMHYFTEE